MKDNQFLSIRFNKGLNAVVFTLTAYATKENPTSIFISNFAAPERYLTDPEICPVFLKVTIERLQYLVDNKIEILN